MTQRRTSLLFFLGICAISLYFAGNLSIALYQYFSLKMEAKAQILEWETLPKKDRVAIKTRYQFKYQDKIIRGEFTFPPRYLNEYAALEAIQIKAKEEQTVWFNPRHPKSSALQKNFPTSLTFKTIICIAVIIYFFCIFKRFNRV
jgi:hypothetical protein